MLGCESGGPTQSVISYPMDEWRRAKILVEIVALSISEREAMANAAREGEKIVWGNDSI